MRKLKLILVIISVINIRLLMRKKKVKEPYNHSVSHAHLNDYYTDYYL